MYLGGRCVIGPAPATRRVVADHGEGVGITSADESGRESMRTRLRLPILIAGVVALVMGGASPAGADHGTRPSTPNVHAKGHSPQPATFFGEPDGARQISSDIAFWGRTAYQGNYDGFRVIDDPVGDFMDVMAVPRADPAGASLIHREPLAGPTTDVRTGCHDAAVILGDVNKAACASADTINVWDVGDNGTPGGSPEDPALLFTIIEPGVGEAGTNGRWHSAGFTWDGQVIVAGWDRAAAPNPSARPPTPTTTRACSSTTPPPGPSSARGSSRVRRAPPRTARSTTTTSCRSAAAAIWPSAATTRPAPGPPTSPTRPTRSPSAGPTRHRSGRSSTPTASWSTSSAAPGR